MPIVGGIALVFPGTGAIGVGTLLGRRLTGRSRRAAPLAVAVGLVTAAFHSIRSTGFVMSFSSASFWDPARLLAGYLPVIRTRQPGRVTRPGSHTSVERSVGARP